MRLGQAWSLHSLNAIFDEGGNENALDDFCDSARVVVGWFGLKLHDGWIHSPVAGAGAGRARAEPGDWSQGGLAGDLAGESKPDAVAHSGIAALNHDE